MHTYIQRDIQTNIQTDRQTDRQTEQKMYVRTDMRRYIHKRHVQALLVAKQQKATAAVAKGYEGAVSTSTLVWLFR